MNDPGDLCNIWIKQTNCIWIREHQAGSVITYSGF